MLIAISGSQGCGKSTTLNTIRYLGYKVVDRKTSRSILQEWGVSLQDINDNEQLTLQFQEEIIRRKVEDELIAVESPDVWFTERTFSDLFCYSLITLGNNNKHSDWINEYYRRCMRYNQSYTHVFYLKSGFFTPEHDGTRGSNQHYSRMVDLIMLDFTKQMVSNNKLTVVDTPNLQIRTDIITMSF